MIILLPPSEGKNFPDPSTKSSAKGQLSRSELLAALPFNQELQSSREQVLDELTSLPLSEETFETVGVTIRKQDEVAATLEMFSYPPQAAREVYSGVLYQAADWNQWKSNAVAENCFVVSALWGLVRPSDLIHAYRCPMGTKLPQLGALKSFWKQPISKVLNRLAQDELIVDLRSGTYQSVWPATQKQAEQAKCVFVPVKVVTLVKGVEKVVSHNAKHARGELAGFLVKNNLSCKTPEELLQAAQAMALDGGYSVREARLEDKSERVFELILRTE
ncbi:hypothetical protein BSR28_08265 [Boudabousia liubingyangii]|uniref:YaaA family protein n=1 Tax=Boudabousia liubingyangii TaxID=1921764 RepID=UPI00093B6854|nr:peroxide stress protein YaaA [Boudabousia liubingyangii]OKL46502.1 hypothetical protein BSR28_08265 [Boudabousia liubingyangii]